MQNIRTGHRINTFNCLIGLATNFPTRVQIFNIAIYSQLRCSVRDSIPINSRVDQDDSSVGQAHRSPAKVYQALVRLCQRKLNYDNCHIWLVIDVKVDTLGGRSTILSHFMHSGQSIKWNERTVNCVNPIRDIWEESPFTSKILFLMHHIKREIFLNSKLVYLYFKLSPVFIRGFKFN